MRRKSLVGEFDQAIDLPQIAFGFLAIEVSGKQRDRGADDAQNHAPQIEIFLEFVEEALFSTVEIGHDARMNRQDWVLVVGVGRFDLTGEWRFGYQLGFGREKGSRDRSSHGVQHRVWRDEAVGDGEGCHRIIGSGRPPPERSGGHVDQLEAGKPLVDRLRLVDGRGCPERLWSRA